MWVGLFPQFSEVGGIQQVSRHIGAALSTVARDRGLPCHLLGLNDPRGQGSFVVPPREYSYQGFARHKLAAIARLLRSIARIELLILGHVNLAPLGAILRLANPRIKYWIVAHGVEVWEPLPAYRRWALRRAQGVLSVSAYTADRMANVQKLDPRNVFVLSPSLDPTFVRTESAPDAPPVAPGCQLLLTVGRLLSAEPGKGVDTVIRALPEVLKKFPSLLYVIVGDGDMTLRLEKLADSLLVRSHVLFAGKLDTEQLRRFYSRCDIYVMPSRQEGFGIVFLEAMALGKPVIAGDYGGTPEIVQNGLTGFLVKPDCPSELGQLLVRLLQDKGLCRKMGEAGRQRVGERYTFPRFQERLRDILDTAL